MPSNTLAKLVVRLEAENDKLRTDLDKASGRIKRFETTSKKSLDGFSRAAKAAFGVFSVAAAGAAIKGALDFADSIDKAAQKAGISATALQELRFAGDQVGVSTQQLDDGMRRLTRRLGEFANSGGGPAQKAIEGLGLAVKDANGKLRPTEAVFNDIVKSMESMESQAQRSAYAAQLFGDDAGPLLELLLKQGSDGINKLRDDAQQLGVVMDESMVQNAVEAKDKLTALSNVLSTQFATAVSNLAPTLISFANLMVSASKSVTDFFNSIQPIAFQNMENLRENLAEVNEEIETYQQQIAQIEKFGGSADYQRQRVQELEEEKQKYQSMIDLLSDLQKGRENAGLTPPTSGGAPDAPIISTSGSQGGGLGGATTNPLIAQADRLRDQLFPLQAAVKEYQQNLELIQYMDLDPEQKVQAIQLIEKAFADATGGPRKLADESEEAFEEMSVFADEAARNMQDAFADFLFDPFDQGLDGMLQGFEQTLRRMAANAAAEQIFSAVKSSSFGEAIAEFIPGFASGTTFAPGGLAMVGEDGPEIVNLPRGSQVIPNNQMNGLGGFTVNVNVSGQNVENTRASAGQIGRQIAMELDRARRRNG